MNVDRFAELAHAFGADVERWPGVEREAARRLRADRSDLTEAHLTATRRLDSLLDAAPESSLREELRRRILRAAPVARVRSDASEKAWRWLAALGLATSLLGAAAAGVAAGFAVTPEPLASPRANAPPDPAEEAALLLREPSDLGEG